MIKTIQLDVTGNFLIGLLIARWAGPKLRMESSLFNRYFIANMLYSVFVFGPIGYFLFTYYPDWSVMYTVDPSGYGPMAGFFAMYAYIVSSIAGYVVGDYLSRSHRHITHGTVIYCTVALLAAISVVGISRLWHVGTFAEFHGDAEMSWLPFSWLGLNLAWIGVYFSLPLVYIYRKIQIGW